MLTFKRRNQHIGTYHFYKKVTDKATEAKETARAAAEARDIALKAAKEAAKASEYATKQAEAAKLKCQQIEAEAKKKLAALRGKGILWDGMLP